MNVVFEACALSNLGVSFLVQNNEKDAKAVFKKALGMIQTAVNNIDLHNQAKSGLLESVPSASHLCPQPCEVALPSSDSATPAYIFKRPLVFYRIKQEFRGTPDEIDSLITSASATVLFNLALTFHQQQESTSAAERNLFKAKKFYQMSRQVIENGGNTTEAADSFLPALALLCLNNEAQIHDEFCDYSESAICFNVMAQLMPQVQNLHAILNEVDFIGISMNIQLHFAPSAACAA